jgi:hypothetical protein
VRHTVSRMAGPGAVAGYLTLQWLGRTWGATRQDRPIWAGRAVPEIAFAVRGFLTVRRSSLRIPLCGSLAIRPARAVVSSPAS